MKVLHVCESVTGGIATYLNELIPHQIRLYGVENVRLVIAKAQVKELTLPNSIMFTFNELNRHSLVAQCKMSRVYFSQIEEFQPAVTHVHSTFAGVWFRLPTLVTKKAYCKVVYCSHGWAFDMQKPMWVKRIYALIEKVLLRKTDHVVCISEHDKKLAMSFGIPKTKLNVVRNTVEPVNEKFEAIDLDEHFINYLYVGRFDKQKGFDILARAVQASKNKRFRVYCIGGAVVSNSDTASCFQDSRLIALGWKPKKEVLQYMNSCDALIVPSRWEGFGLVALEALVCGCPVFHSGAGGLSEILPNSEYSTQLKAPLDISLQALFNVDDKKIFVDRKKQLSKDFKLTYTVKDLAAELDKIYRN